MSWNWGQVVVYIGRAKGHAGDFLPQTLPSTLHTPSKNESAPKKTTKRLLCVSVGGTSLVSLTEADRRSSETKLCFKGFDGPYRV